ncbi:5-oxoprolinase subunit PxpB [Aquiflexum sp. TKW24L]|uniref:5-oxoprolinase subunit PxpB n=1 Tax=Aquiflexum sp. TKW24L TaxID=2942212 RepID=UPI0020BDBEFB|nr:5-oxoprolinase subunit PxpB [Aquiflexum sp. TKW24L]MCL6258853.1 5-oxoprolinase subunit PxpB [Aquiflexum sp. TKW24L]
MDIRIFRIHSKLIELVWPQVISIDILQEQQQVKQFFEKEYADGIREIRVGFNTLSLKLRIEITEEDCRDILEEIHQLPTLISDFASKTWKIPVCYCTEYGKDLEKLVQIHKISLEEIIRLHSEATYTLHFYGFLPGFMYLGGLPEKLHTPRKNSPERAMPGGTVAIGGKQTGIYPAESPGGWHAIGNCPIRLFDISKEVPVIPAIGDKINFEPISKEVFEEIKQFSHQGLYTWHHD